MVSSKCKRFDAQRQGLLSTGVLALPFVLSEGLRVRGVTRRTSEEGGLSFSWSSPRSIGFDGSVSPSYSSSCTSTSMRWTQRAYDTAPSTHRRILRLVSRRRLVIVRHGMLPALLLPVRLGHRLSAIPLAMFSFCHNVGIVGMAESMTGCDGKRRGSMYGESKNSPRTSGGLTGSQEVGSSSRSKRRSMLCFALNTSVEAEEKEAACRLTLSFKIDEASSCSRSSIFKSQSLDSGAILC
jgi:hypothetical protein